MNLTYFDNEAISEKTIVKHATTLASYREKLKQWHQKADPKTPESALFTWQDDAMLQQVYTIAEQFKNVKHVLLLGIGGSSLGTEAIHSVLATKNSPQLHVLDTVSGFELQRVLDAVSKVQQAKHLAVCVVSKSGSTTETLANASVVLDELKTRLGKDVYNQTVFIGNSQNALLKDGKKLGVRTIKMPEAVGGRYSVFTPVGLVPLTLLGHDVEAILSGLQDATTEPFEASVAESAPRLFLYLKKKYTNVNFFAFDTRMVRLGKWYRQLTAESLGKEYDKDKQPVKLGFVPTISTPVELHSIGQLYFSGFKGVYTDFVTFDDDQYDFEVNKKTTLAAKLKGKSLQEIGTAIYGGVIGAYQELQLPYRSTVLEGDLDYSLGLFMGMRMLETMYLAQLLNVNAFNQPNVELYKDKTRAILGV